MRLPYCPYQNQQSTPNITTQDEPQQRHGYFGVIGFFKWNSSRQVLDKRFFDSLIFYRWRHLSHFG
jgi:hypothetical protein